MNKSHMLSLATLALVLGGSQAVAQQKTAPPNTPPSTAPAPKGKAPELKPGSLEMREVRNSKLPPAPGLQVGDILEARLGMWMGENAKPTIQWTRCKTVGSCIPIPQATLERYELTKSDEDNRISFTVTAVGLGGKTSENGPVSNPVTKPKEVAPMLAKGFLLEVTEVAGRGNPPGALHVGSTLMANPGKWDMPLTGPEQIQWERCANSNPNSCQPISGATHKDYMLGTADVSHGIRFVLTVDARGVKGSAESKVAGPIKAAPAPTAPTKKP